MRYWVYKNIHCILQATLGAEAKNTIIRNSPFLLKDQWYFLLSGIIVAHWGELFVCLIPVHFLHVSITVSYDLTGQKLLCGKARNTVDPLKERE